MTRALSILCSAALTIAASAQTRPEFEVASVRPSAEPTTQVNVGVRISGSQVRMTFLSLKDYIGIAYSVRVGQVVAPDWVAQERFDIAAKIPDDAPSGQVAAMLQSLLADRFGLRTHRESREFPVYALVIDRAGLKLDAVPPDPDAPAGPPAAVNVGATGSAAGVGIDLGGGSSFTFGNNRLEGKKVTMTQLVDGLTRFLDRPVIDVTGLTGRYDVALDLAPEDYLAMMVRSALNAGVNLPPQAMRALDNASLDPLSPGLKKYGLVLDSRRAPLDVIVVDEMQKTPTAN